MTEYCNCERKFKSAVRPKRLEGEGAAEWLSISKEPKYELVEGEYCDECELSSKCVED